MDAGRRLGRHFSRAEPRRRAISYLLGLLSEAPRKNGCNLAVQANESTPDGMHRLLTTAKWDVDGVRDELRQYVVELHGCPEAVLAVTQAYFPKRGDHSAGVQRQYSESSQRVENCQLGLFLAYVSPHGTKFIDRELYLPGHWMEDNERRASAGVPGRAFGTRSELACRMLRRALNSKVPASWVVASERHDLRGGIRKWLEKRQAPYVVEVRPSVRFSVQTGSRVAVVRADEFLRQALVFRPLKGLRTANAQWSRLPLMLNSHTGTARWLVVRKSSEGNKRISYYLAFGPATTPLPELARIAGTHQAATAELARAKARVGLDDYEARRYEAWYRHVTLALFAYALVGGGNRGRAVEGRVARTAAVASAARMRATTKPRPCTGPPAARSRPGARLSGEARAAGQSSAAAQPS